MDEYLVTGFILRIVTSGILLCLPINVNIKIFMIFLTDFLDCGKLLNYFYKSPCDKICKTYTYQSIDKFIDLMTYIAIYFYTGLQPLFMYIILFRMIGINLFYMTYNSDWLVVFPDLFKEVLIYSWVYNLTPVKFAYIFVIKTIFEYIWHKYHNSENYKQEMQTDN